MLGEQQGDSSLDSPRAFLTRRGGFNESIVEGQAATDRSNGSMPESLHSACIDCTSTERTEAPAQARGLRIRSHIPELRNRHH